MNQRVCICKVLGMATSSCTETCACEPLNTQTFCTLPPLAALGKPVPELGCGGYYLDPLRKLVHQWQGGIIQAASNPPRGSSRPSSRRYYNEQSTGGGCCGKDFMRRDDAFMTTAPYAGGNRDNNTCRSRCARVYGPNRGGFAARIQSRPVAQPYVSIGRCGSVQLQSPTSLPGAQLM